MTKTVVIPAEKLGVLEQHIRQAIGYKLKKDRRTAMVRTARVLRDLKLDGAIEKTKFLGFVVGDTGELYAILADHAELVIIGEVGPT